MLQPVAGGERSIRVADVGAGTGQAHPRGAWSWAPRSSPIDPDPQMLAALRENVHGVPTFVGSAEKLPLPDASVDAVVLGQAWHWVEPAAGSAEVARVLRSGGVLGLVWNLRDESVPWVARLTRDHARQPCGADARARATRRRRAVRRDRERRSGDGRAR